MKFVFLYVLAFSSCLSSLFCEVPNIRIELFQGKEIESHIQEVVELCHMIYREDPYYYKEDEEEYESYLKSYSQATDALTCLVFHNKKAIGLGIGVPMQETREPYKIPLLQADYNLQVIFYIGEFGLDSAYCNQGIEEKMYERIESFAKEHKYAKLCLWEIDNSSDSNKVLVSDFQNSFWKKVGFIRHSKLNFFLTWTNIGNTRPTSHEAIYWIKNL
jgi:hypothetical protein